MVILCNIHGMTEFKEWVSKVTSHASTREIGRCIDMNHVTVSRHINSASVQFCIDLANAYDVNPIPGLIAAKAITKHQIDEYSRSHGLNDYTDLELAQEIVNRLQTAEEGREERRGLTEPIELATLRKKSNTTTPDVATPDYLDGTVEEWDDTIPHAADSSPDEDQLREEEGASDIP